MTLFFEAAVSGLHLILGGLYKAVNKPKSGMGNVKKKWERRQGLFGGLLIEKSGESWWDEVFLALKLVAGWVFGGLRAG